MILKTRRISITSKYIIFFYAHIEQLRNRCNHGKKDSLSIPQNVQASVSESSNRFNQLFVINISYNNLNWNSCNLVSLKVVEWCRNTSLAEYDFINKELKIIGVTSPRIYIHETKHWYKVFVVEYKNIMVVIPSFIHKSISVNTLSFRVDLQFHSIFFNTDILLTIACHIYTWLRFSFLPDLKKNQFTVFPKKRSEQKRKPL